jgi:hypothetical protein
MVIGIVQVFDESTVAWDSGIRRSEAMMTGRAIVDLAASEGAVAFCDPIPVSSFSMRQGVNDEVQIAHADASGGAQRTEDGISSWLVEEGGGITVAAVDLSFGPGTLQNPPRYADVFVETETDDKGRTESRFFDTRVFLINRDRYRYDVE